MIKAEFFSSAGVICGFCIKGHSGFAEQGSDIVCASVSSAAYMTANTVTEIIGVKADIRVDDGLMELKLGLQEAQRAREILKGFELHMLQHREQYPNYITLKFSEV